jgi:hypothetical protein
MPLRLIELARSESERKCRSVRLVGRKPEDYEARIMGRTSHSTSPVIG